MNIRMKLDKEPFELTEKGLKTIEVRLSDEKRKGLKKGDTIEFSHPELGELIVNVLDVRHYKSIDELIKLEDFSKTGGLYLDEDQWRNHILSYYPMEKQIEFGILSIEIELK